MEKGVCFLHTSFFMGGEMNIAIVEDEPAIVEQLTGLIRRFGAEHDMAFEIFSFGDGIDFLDRYKSIYDIVCMDIEMPHSNGMRIAQKLREVDQAVTLVFITNLAQYALEGYVVSAAGYIVKPLSYGAFCFHFERAMRSALRSKKRTVSIMADKELIRLHVDDIFYLEVVNHAVIYHTAQGEFETWNSLSNAEKKLPAGEFARCNNCFLVNLRHVREVKGETAFVGNISLKISRAKKKDFMAALTECL